MLLTIRWTAATVLGLAAGGFVLHFPGSFGGLTSWDPTAVVAGAIFGFVTGAAVGAVQWLALLLPWRAGMRLLLAMGLGIAVTHGLNDGAPDSFGLISVAILSGVAMTAAFAALFAHRSPVALALGAVGWTGGQLFADWLISALGMPWHYSIEHTVAGVAIALAWAILTAVSGLPAAIDRWGSAPTQARQL